MPNITSHDYLNHRMMTFTPDVPFEPDPWVKVGTTTIDGLISHVVERIGGDENDLMGWRTPRLVGGQMLVGHEFGATQDGMVVMRCDIVRRQSEIDAEKCKRLCAHCETPSDTQFCEACVDGFRAMEPPCPECGPHGNRGEVLLASSWAKCTTCAGGKPGDLWGEVKVEESATYDKIGHHPGGGFPDDRFSIKESPDLSGPLTVTIGGRGFKVPTLVEMRGAALDDLRRLLESNAITYDDDSIAKASRVIEERLASYCVMVPEPIKIRITES